MSEHTPHQHDPVRPADPHQVGLALTDPVASNLSAPVSEWRAADALAGVRCGVGAGSACRLTLSAHSHPGGLSLSPVLITGRTTS